MALAAVVQACASFSANDASGSPTANLADTGVHTRVVDGSASEGGTSREAGIPLNPLCGTVGRCAESQPDDPLACRAFSADAGRQHPAPDAGTAIDASLPSDGSRDAGARRDAGDGASSAAHADAGLRNDGTDSSTRTGGPSFLDAPAPYVPIPEQDAGPRFSCQVHAVDNGEPIHECAPAGPGGTGDPCSDGSYCRAGFACVGPAGEQSATSGLCQPYCCARTCSPVPRGDGGDEPTFCSERPLIQHKGAPALVVPVCVPAERCLLDEPYPCPTGSSCRCAPDTACTVVDPVLGTTGCVKPGKGRLGDACPCAWGYFCSAAGTCLKQCQTSATDDPCHPGKCQAAAGLPEGWGLCEGAAPTTR